MRGKPRRVKDKYCPMDYSNLFTVEQSPALLKESGLKYSCKVCGLVYFEKEVFTQDQRDIWISGMRGIENVLDESSTDNLKFDFLGRLPTIPKK